MIFTRVCRRGKTGFFRFRHLSRQFPGNSCDTGFTPKIPAIWQYPHFIFFIPISAFYPHFSFRFQFPFPRFGFSVLSLPLFQRTVFLAIWGGGGAAHSKPPYARKTGFSDCPVCTHSDSYKYEFMFNLCEFVCAIPLAFTIDNPKNMYFGLSMTMVTIVYDQESHKG